MAVQAQHCARLQLRTVWWPDMLVRVGGQQARRAGGAQAAAAPHQVPHPGPYQMVLVLLIACY